MLLNTGVTPNVKLITNSFPSHYLFTDTARVQSISRHFTDSSYQIHLCFQFFHKSDYLVYKPYLCKFDHSGCCPK